jgi:predicted nucleic acid-binding protein
MTFADIPAGSSVFIDANVFVYHFVSDPAFGPACRDLLDRISRNEITGFTSSSVLSDVAHRLMTYEAVDTYGWPMAGIAYRLKRHPTELAALVRFRRAVEEVPNFGVQTLSTETSHVFDAASLSQQHGLLSGDALVVAVMQANGLMQLTSNDSDFDRVPWITRYAPA